MPILFAHKYSDKKVDAYSGNLQVWLCVKLRSVHLYVTRNSLLNGKSWGVFDSTLIGEALDC